MKRAKLWKRILNEGLDTFLVDCPVCDGGNADAVALKVIQSTCIVARSESRLPDATDDPGELNVFRGIAPPFPMYWIDWEDPDLESDRQVEGSLVFADRRPDGGGWRVTCIECWCAHDTRPHAGSWWQADVSGAGAVDGGSLAFASPEKTHPDWAPDDPTHTAVVVNFAGKLFSMLAVMGCRNVALAPRDHEPNHVRRAVRRAGGDPSRYRYHVLLVRPPGAKSSDGPGEEVGIMPWHVCAGHFQHFGPAAVHGHPDGKDRGLLFGQYAGRFYIPTHMRGDKKNGVVAKDYVVPPGAANPGSEEFP